MRRDLAFLMWVQSRILVSNFPNTRERLQRATELAPYSPML